jgi:hypothetical protein
MDVFIISWAGRHQDAINLIRHLKHPACHPTVIYSDPDPVLTPSFGCTAVRRPNHLFWGDKFQACLEAAQSDSMLVIHADCICSDWNQLVERFINCIARSPDVGVWAPLIDGTIHNINNTRLFDVPRLNLSIASKTDAIVFGLTAPIMARMRKADYTKNIYGWGIDVMMNCAALSLGMVSVVDQSVAVEHPVGAGYERTIAQKQMREFLKQLDPIEHNFYMLMNELGKARRAVRSMRQDGTRVHSP